MNNDTQNGLMSSPGLKQTTTIMDEMRRTLAPRTGAPTSLEDRLAALTEAKRRTVLQTAKLVQSAMLMHVAAGDQSMGYRDLIRSMYGNLPNDIADLVAAVLDDTNPLSFVPQPKPKPDPVAAQLSVYDDWNLSMDGLPALPGLDEQEIERFSAVEAQDPNQLSFLDQLEASESSGKADAEITIKDGRRFVGKLQFGKARLQDYQNATGTIFTQDEFIKDAELQDKVATWHIADLDKAIDALGDAAADYDRDGLRAVAHLGGKAGMKKFVQSKGDYNPADELGTSLQSYYEKFSKRGDA